jgi:hypothetical protein
MSIWHSDPDIGKKMDILITLFPMLIFSNPIQGKGKMAQGIRFCGKNTLKRLPWPSILRIWKINNWKFLKKNKNIQNMLELTIISDSRWSIAQKKSFWPKKSLKITQKCKKNDYFDFEQN